MTEFYADGDGSQEGLLAKRSAAVCLSEKELEDFLFCRLSGVTREVVEEHLLVCHACLDRAEKEEHYVASLKAGLRRLEDQRLDAALASGPAAPRRGPASTWIWPGWRAPVWGAAALAVALAAGLYWQRSTPGPRTEVRLALTRGTAGGGSGPAGGRLALAADLAGLPARAAYRIQLVRADGTEAAAQTLPPTGTQVRWEPATRLPAGQYWVRLSTEAGELLREYSLQLR